MNPKISVVMPVLNGEAYLKEAIESILGQTFADFEFIIINDGSTDKTSEIILSYKDPRIKYFNNGRTRGLSYSFNRGISAARGEFLARMDADDLSVPHRFDRQVRFLETHPEIGIVGSSVTLIDKDGKETGTLRRPTRPTLVKWSSLFSTPLTHPSVMGRTGLFKRNPYDETIHNSEDYELWSRLLFRENVSIANIAEPLLSYRVYSGAFTQKLSPEQNLASAKNSIMNLMNYIELDDAEAAVLTSLRQGKRLAISELGKVLGIYVRAALAFRRKGGIGLMDLFGMLKSLLASGWFLFKYLLKQFLR